MDRSCAVGSTFLWCRGKATTSSIVRPEPRAPGTDADHRADGLRQVFGSDEVRIESASPTRAWCASTTARGGGLGGSTTWSTGADPLDFDDHDDRRPWSVAAASGGRVHWEHDEHDDRRTTERFHVAVTVSAFAAVRAETNDEMVFEGATGMTDRDHR